MSSSWGNILKRFRLRHGLRQERMAALIEVSQGTISRWERGQDQPSLAQQKRLRDIGWKPPADAVESLVTAVPSCLLPRALSRTPRLRLQALSAPALVKRPSMANWIGRDLAPIAAGILAEMLDDRALQKATARREVAGVIATTSSVLNTAESSSIGTYRTTITYFFHEGSIYSDAISLPVSANEPCGYTPLLMDEVGEDLFGDGAELESAMLAACSRHSVESRRR